MIGTGGGTSSPLGNRQETTIKGKHYSETKLVNAFKTTEHITDQVLNRSSLTNAPSFTPHKNTFKINESHHIKRTPQQHQTQSHTPRYSQSCHKQHPESCTDHQSQDTSTNGPVTSTTVFSATRWHLAINPLAEFYLTTLTA